MVSTQNLVSSYMFKFMLDCRKAIDIIASSNDKKEIKCLAILTRATYHLACARTVFLLDQSIYDDEIDILLYKAETFLNETTENIYKGIGYSWSNFSYEDLIEAYESSALNEKYEFKEEG